METLKRAQEETKIAEVGLPSAQEVSERLGGVSLMQYLAREIVDLPDYLMPAGWTTRTTSDGADIDVTS